MVASTDLRSENPHRQPLHAIHPVTLVGLSMLSIPVILKVEMTIRSMKVKHFSFLVVRAKAQGSVRCAERHEDGYQAAHAT
jgi:hypothetical protein